jgi:carbon-monoxide dehydrogenase small subunit
MHPRLVTLKVNGRSHAVALAPNVTLLQALRDLGYTDVKNGCEKGDCGACAVLLNGQAVNSCLVLAWQAEGAAIVTNSGLGTLEGPHPLQEAFADHGAIQCGYCTPGMIVAAKALLDENPNPTETEIRNAISGNLCRCTGYGQIVQAIQIAAAKMYGGDPAIARSGATTLSRHYEERGDGAISSPLENESSASHHSHPGGEK